MTHDQLQSACFQWVWNYFPSSRRCLFMVPNEIEWIKGESEKSRMIRANKLKNLGMVPGAWDIVFYWKKVLYLFEFKVGSDKLSDNQIKFEVAITDQGGQGYEIRDIEQFKERFRWIMSQ